VGKRYFKQLLAACFMKQETVKTPVETLVKTPVETNRQSNAADYYAAFDEDLTKVSENGRTVLHRAAENNNLNIIKALVGIPAQKQVAFFKITDEVSPFDLPTF
jgi:ankyrin repeat protein